MSKLLERQMIKLFLFFKSVAQLLYSFFIYYWLIYILIFYHFLYNNIYIFQMNDQKKLVKKPTTYRNLTRIVCNILAVVCGSFYFGYTLAYLSAIPFFKIKSQFNINIDQDSALGIFSGIIPFGAGVGSLLSAVVSKKFSRKNSLLFTCGISLIGGICVQISYFQLLLIGRFIQGICVGIYSSLCPLYIKEFVPKQLGGILGTFNQIFIVLGITTTNIFGFFVQKYIEQMPSLWRYVFGIPILVAIMQALLLFFIYNNETPKYLIINGQQNQALKLIRQIYKEQYVQQIFNQKIHDVKGKTFINTESEDCQVKDKKKVQRPRKYNSISIMVAIHLGFLQAVCGINILVLYGVKILEDAVPGKGGIMQIFLVLILLISGILSAYFLTKIGRKRLIQIGTMTSFLVLLCLSIIYLKIFQTNNKLSYSQEITIVILVYVFMLIFGLTLGPVVWLYIPEIVPPEIIPYSTFANWTGATITIILFPILSSYFGNSSIFFVFSIWSAFSYVINSKFIVETKDKSESQIKQQYELLNVK